MSLQKKYAHSIESNTCYELTTTHVITHVTTTHVSLLTTTRVTTTHVTCYPQTEGCTSKLQGRRSKPVQNSGELKLKLELKLELKLKLKAS